ncbi:MAG: ABC transporter substrate-binding protein [Rhodospirillales bacterium]|nr:ABC transporter substrate-binding protein [Rhodospirillales bacterium]
MTRLAVLLLALLAALPVSARAADTITVAYLRDINNLPMFHAESAGIFAKYGIKVVNRPLNDGAAAASAVVSGAADMGYAAVAIPISARDAGQKLRIFANVAVEIYPYTPNMTVLLASRASGVANVAGLKGKKVVVNAISGGCALTLFDQLRHVGLKRSDVSVVVAPFPQVPAILRLRQADAACIVEPFWTMMRSDPALAPRVLSYGTLAGQKTGASDVLSGYFASTAWLAAHRALAARFIAAMIESSQELAGKPKIYRAELTKYFGLKPAIAQQITMAITPDRIVARPEGYQPVLDAIARSHMLAHPLTPAQLVETIAPAAPK